MKINLTALAAAFILLAPVVGYAQQPDTGLTRAQVRAELVQLEKAGYSPSHGRDPYYPDDIQAALAKIQAANPVAANATTSGYGGSENGTSEAASPTAVRAVPSSIYFGH
jgi:cytochrome c556